MQPSTPSISDAAFTLLGFSGGGDCDEAQPWFDPHQELNHVYLKLSEGELPYSERLRIRREAVAPTADRGGYQHAHSRLDHFVATALGWRLTYENAYGHQIRVAFPPEDEDRARRTMLDAAARMGCRVLAATARMGVLAATSHRDAPVWGYVRSQLVSRRAWRRRTCRWPCRCR